MVWVDTHCHLQLDGRPPVELLDRATNVSWLVVPGIDLESSRAARAISDAHPDRVLWTAGLHPHEASQWPAERAGIEELAAEAAAIGETGLDFYRNLSPKEAQIESFRGQIELAGAFDIPLIVHCRDAFADVFDIIETTGIGPRAVLHCWTGGTRWTRRFLDLGVTFSFAGPVAFETGDTVRGGAELVPPDRALVETDTPYLAPPPHRGELNEPAYVEFNGRALGEVWGMEVAEVAEVTAANSARIFSR